MVLNYLLTDSSNSAFEQLFDIIDCLAGVYGGECHLDTADSKLETIGRIKDLGAIFDSRSLSTLALLDSITFLCEFGEPPLEIVHNLQKSLGILSSDNTTT